MASAALLRQVRDLSKRGSRRQLTLEQHVLPLAGLTTAIALYPRRTAYAEEPVCLCARETNLTSRIVNC